MSNSNPWLARQRKSDLVELADNVGLKNYDSLKKADLEVSLDEYLSEHASSLSSDPKLAPYYSSRAKASGSPVKKETVKDEAEKALKVTKRRATRVADEINADASNVVARTPGRSLSLASRIPLPATPADVANAVDRGTTALRKRAASLYQESGITEGTQATREALSTVNSVLASVAAFELWYLRAEVLPDRYAFTIPAIHLLGTDDYPVKLPDMFLLLTASFWAPVAIWALTSFILPATFGYFFNLTVGAHHVRSRKLSNPDYVIDPLTFSIVKALFAYVVYAQGVTFGGLLDETSVTRIDRAIYGGWQGVLAGAGITALISIYDAVLKK